MKGPFFVQATTDISAGPNFGHWAVSVRLGRAKKSVVTLQLMKFFLSLSLVEYVGEVSLCRWLFSIHLQLQVQDQFGGSSAPTEAPPGFKQSCKFVLFHLYFKGKNYVFGTTNGVLWVVQCS